MSRYTDPRFWLPVAAVSGVLVLLAMAIYWPSIGSHELAGDFYAYRDAAARAWSGESLYFAHQLAGPYPAYQPVPNYLYPPPFAALMGWSLLLAPETGAWLWLVASLVAAVGGVYLTLAGAGMMRRRALIAAVAATAWFGPTWHMVMLGNVSGFLTLAIGACVFASARGSGISVAVATLLKVTPAALGPVLLLARPRMLLAAAATTAVVLVPSLVLQLDDWRAFPAALINLSRGSAVFDTNFAPASVAVAHLGAAEGVASIVRLITLIGGVSLIILSLLWARRPTGMAGALAAAVVASLYLPGSLWYHYALAVLPFAAIAWMRATRPMRIALFVSAGAASVAWLLVANAVAAGALIALSALILIALRPRATS